MEDAIAELDPVLTLLVSAVLPLVLSVVYGIRAADRYKALLAFLVTLALGVGLAWWDGDMSRDGIVLHVGAVYVISQTIEARLYKPAGISDSLQKNVLPGGITGTSSLTSVLGAVAVVMMLVGVTGAASRGVT